MVNELDYILVFIILLGVGIGLRRGLIRIVVSTIGIYFTVLVAGYAYEPIGDTLADGLARLGIPMETVGTHNFTYIVVVIAMTVVVELVSRSTFEVTRLRYLPSLDKLLGGIAGVFYGALWASLFLVPGQYSVARA